VLLLDELLSAVDGEAREELQSLLGRVCRAEAFALADICAVMIAGEVRQTGRAASRRP
jgi:ABC-type proline/glycine betaine transport system ATPase subunit